MIFQVFVGAQRFLSGPTTLEGAIQIRDRFIDAFEAGWSLSELQKDLQSTCTGHEGVAHIPKEERVRETARLGQIFDQAKQSAVQPPPGAAAPKLRAKAKAKQRQRARGMQPAPE